MRQYPALAQQIGLEPRLYCSHPRQRRAATALAHYCNFDWTARSNALGGRLNFDSVANAQRQLVRAKPGGERHGQDSHCNEVGAVNALET